MMRTTETSSFTSHSSSFLILSKLPSTFSHPTVHFRAKLTPSFSTPPSYDNYANSASCGRRGLFFLSVTMPFLSLLPDYVKYFQAEAKEYGTSEYSLIQDEIRKVLSKGKAAGVLRLVFHDAGTFESSDNSGGMNGSVVYELDRPENAGLKKSLKILEKAKNVLDVKQSVSWADLIAVAGAEAVLLCGGPVIPIRVGRLDSLIPDPEGKLPEESLDAPRLKQCFQKKGFLTQELVALSGAHTLGSKGFGNPIVFDNSYYKILLEKPWRSSAEMTSMIGLPSDRALVEDDECLRSIWKQSLCYCKGKVCFPPDLPLTSLIAGASSRVLRWITEYANDQDMFFEDFKNAYIKLVNSGVSWRAS